MAREQWLQGHVLPEAAAREIETAADGSVRYVVCSHSCDIGTLAGKQLFVAKGRVVAEEDGNLVGAKTIDTLQVTSLAGAIIHYDIASLQMVDVSILDKHDPWTEEGYNPNDLLSLAVWLAQRFNRITLPDDVVNALKDSDIQDVLNDKLKKTAHEIVDVRVRLDETTTPPTVSFAIIYDSGTTNGKERAEAVATAIMRRAEKNAADLEKRVTVDAAVAMSNSEVRVSQLKGTYRWRAEHISLRTKPPAELPVE